MVSEPTICLPHRLQNACPGCTVVPHPSQNIDFLRAASPAGRLVKTYAQPIPVQEMLRKWRVKVHGKASAPLELQRLPALLHADGLASKNEKTTRQQGGLLFSRENSSNGGKAVKTFCTKSYGPKKGGVKLFLGNKCL
jgi:hypothetical protein